MLDAAERAGAGTQRYELINVAFGYPPKSVKELFEEYRKKGS